MRSYILLCRSFHTTLCTGHARTGQAHQLSVAGRGEPSFSIDGRTLYFSSNRPGGKGGRDIWKTTLGNDGRWSKAENMGDSINTAMDEVSPFIHYDDQTMYFSSNGHVGMGGFDIYYTRKTSDSTWSSPTNIGYPINTDSDELNLVVGAGGKMAIFSSDKLNGMGGVVDSDNTTGGESARDYSSFVD